ncbi:hypothetical protein FJR48_06460 [Sulfurimonas lithotrophica]|uniref:Uncharacterized protein n=1 Tax=Sulfurimonas lithotrophica TaxID=2590022 RepID=A0A5P8P0Y7_9BACT|nr:hypothetical protein [Sulfurimonas lithotrophica]QFR49386.1 hypothetical protein FJR48_06460 [Sulfurimonas lithotrophica]
MITPLMVITIVSSIAILLTIIIAYKKINDSNKLVIDELNKLQTFMSSQFKELDENNTSMTKKVENLQSNIDSSFVATQKSLQHIRLDNIINFHTELAKYKNGIYEDDHFIQEVGECKVLKLVDKKTNETTNIYYEGGIKNFTETFADNCIKHKMYYSKDGSLLKGEDFNKAGSLVFSYQYDEAGEISSKTEYIYDDNNNIIDEITTKY